MSQPAYPPVNFSISNFLTPNCNSLTCALIPYSFSTILSLTLSLSLSFPPVSKKIDELQQSLKKKDEDMRQMEDRYKLYVEKARTVSTHKAHQEACHKETP